jgi:hypothetical protein
MQILVFLLLLTAALLGTHNVLFMIEFSLPIAAFSLLVKPRASFCCIGLANRRIEPSALKALFSSTLLFKALRETVKTLSILSKIDTV